MTTIIACQSPYGIILGADCQITDGDRRVLSPSTPKFVKVGKYWLGVRGDARAGDVLMYNWTPPIYDNSEPVKFMGKKVVPSIIAAFKAASYDFEKDGTMFGFLLIFGKHIFEIGSDMSISQNHNGIYSIGSGSDYALGYLVAWEECGPLNVDQVLGALATAAKFDVNTAAPFQVEVLPIK